MTLYGRVFTSGFLGRLTSYSRKSRENSYFANSRWVKPRPNDRNISTQHIAILLGATCCVRLATLLRRVATCWVLLAQIWNWSNFSCNICECCMVVVVVWPGCAWSCALVRFSTRNMSQHVETGWPNACNMLRPTMLRSVAFKCCDRLAGASKCWANSVAICCVSIFLSFGRSLRRIGKLHW